MKSQLRNHNGIPLETITVTELIELLQSSVEADPSMGDKGVIFAANYGDYHNTEQALGLDGVLEEVGIGTTGYSHSGFQTLTQDDIYDDDTGELQDREPDEKFVVIR